MMMTKRLIWKQENCFGDISNKYE